MISNPNLILYVCVSKGTTVLVELRSGDRDLETLALQCLENTPSFHAMFSHTIGKRIFSFLMEDPFVYFAILDEDLGKQHGLWFLERIKAAFMKFLKGKSVEIMDDMATHCFHEEFNPIFLHLLDSSADIRVLQPPEIVSRDRPAGFLDSITGKRAVSAPLTGKPSKHSKKKNGASRENPMENRVGVSDYANLNSDFSMSLQRNGSRTGNGGRLQAQKLWWRYVGVVFLIDLMVCSVLFGVWLWICSGFQCIAE